MMDASRSGDYIASGQGNTGQAADDSAAFAASSSAAFLASRPWFDVLAEDPGQQTTSDRAARMTESAVSAAARSAATGNLAGAVALGDSAAARPHLDHCIISPQQRSDRSPSSYSGGVALVLPAGALVRWRSAPSESPSPGVRGEVCGLSAASRRRLMQRLMAVDWSESAAQFLTLTYHDQMPSDWQSWKLHLEAFKMRLTRFLGDRLLGVYWRLEFQRRGAPHYHLVVCWKRGQAPKRLAFRRWAARAWAAIVAPGDAALMRYGVDCRDVDARNAGALSRYLAKYVAKVDGATCVDADGVIERRATGRCWGEWGEVPALVVGVVRFDKYALVKFLEALREHKRYGFVAGLPSYVSGFSMFGGCSAAMDVLLEYGRWSGGASRLRGHPGDVLGKLVNCDAYTVGEVESARWGAAGISA